jgi:spore coat protein H
MRMNNHARTSLVMLGALALGASSACERDDTPSCDGDRTDITRPSSWAEASHCRGVEPDYGKVFGDSVVHRFDISISADAYALMDSDLYHMFWESAPPPDLDDLDDPVWAPVDVRYDGGLWTDVGMRWKGHSSLQGAVMANVDKLSFLLTFDQFEEAHPEIDDQRFWGFKKLIFANGYQDQSFIREKVASEVFRAAGVPTYRMAFTQVYLDRGDGPEYLGLYTVMEDPSDEMLDREFGIYEDNAGDHVVGNLYKPHGDAARWRDPDEVVEQEVDIEVESDAGVTATGTVPANEQWWQEDIEAHFEKCTNDETRDWTDVMDVVDALYDDRRVPEEWRAQLEQVLDVPSFIGALAVSQTITNWDSYGCMHHNYYIYSNPMDHGRFVWLPWDLGETMTDKESTGCDDLEGVMFDTIVGADEDTWEAEGATYWPLIRFVLSDAAYREEYRRDLRAVLDGPFSQANVSALIDKYHALVAPYVVGPTAQESWGTGLHATTCDPHDCSAFLTSVDDLKSHAEARRAAVEAALSAP